MLGMFDKGPAPSTPLPVDHHSLNITTTATIPTILLGDREREGPPSFVVEQRPIFPLCFNHREAADAKERKPVDNVVLRENMGKLFFNSLGVIRRHACSHAAWTFLIS